MLNEVLWFAMMAVNFGAILLAYRMFGKTGLFVWIPIAVIVANMQVLKTVELFGFTNTLGNIVYANSFLVTDILSENYGKKEARKAVYIGFFALIMLTVLMNLALVFIPSPEDFSQESLAAIFRIMPRIALASLAAFWVSQTHDVWAYHFWMRKYPGLQFLWLRNNASTMVSQAIDSALFTLVAFWGVFPGTVLMEIMITTYVMKWIVAALDTPFIYIAKKIKASGRAG